MIHGPRSGRSRAAAAGPEDRDEGHPLAVTGSDQRADAQVLVNLFGQVGHGGPGAEHLAEHRVGLLLAAALEQPPG
jgi:hypothetical protein